MSTQDNKTLPGHCTTPPLTSASMYGMQHGRHISQNSSPGPSSAFFPAQCSTGSFSNYNGDPNARTPAGHPPLMRPSGDEGQNLNSGFGFDTKYLEDYLKVIESFQGGAGDSRNYYDSRNFYDANRSLQNLAETFNYMYANSLRTSVGNNYPSSNQVDSYNTSRPRSVGMPPIQQPLRQDDLNASQNDLRHSTEMQIPNQNDYTNIQPKMEIPEPPETPNQTVHTLPPMSNTSCHLNMNSNNHHHQRRTNYMESNNIMDVPTNGAVSDSTGSSVSLNSVKMSPPAHPQADIMNGRCTTVGTVHHVSAQVESKQVTDVEHVKSVPDIKSPPIGNGSGSKDSDTEGESDADLDDGELSDDDDVASDPDDVADSDMSTDKDEDDEDDYDNDDDLEDIKDEPDDEDTDDEKTDIEDYADVKTENGRVPAEVKEEIVDDEAQQDHVPAKRRRGRKAKPQRLVPESVDEDKKKGRGRLTRLAATRPVRQSVKRKGRKKKKGTKVCEKCGRKFERNDTYQRHLLQHDTIKMFECNICGCKYERQEHLTRHHRSHTGVTYRCGYCDVSFKNQRPYRDHMLSLHGQKKPFICTYPGCLFRAATPSRVEGHAEIHGPEKHYKCEKCNRDFAQINGLRSHQRSCYEKRQYLCDFCGAKFNFLGSLKSHRYIHTGEKPYACSDCDARFTDHRNLRRHRLIHENAYPYPCEFCDKKFRHSNSLKAHNKMHQNIPQWDRPPEVHPSQHPGPMPAMEYLLANVMNQATMNQAAMNPATC